MNFSKTITVTNYPFLTLFEQKFSSQKKSRFSPYHNRRHYKLTSAKDLLTLKNQTPIILPKTFCQYLANIKHALLLTRDLANDETGKQLLVYPTQQLSRYDERCKKYPDRRIKAFLTNGATTIAKTIAVILCNDDDDDSIYLYFTRAEYLFFTQEVSELLFSFCKDPIAFVSDVSRRFGICAMCRRPLKNETSVERAMGPVCYKHMLQWRNYDSYMARSNVKSE